MTRSSCWALAAALIALGGCAKRSKPPAPPGPQIKKVKVVGANAVDESTVIDHLNMQPSKTFGEKFFYIPGLEVLDRERIEALYETYGHYQAEVESIDVTVVNPKRKVKKQRAKVRIEVEEGPGTVVESVSWTWGRSVDHGHPINRKAVVEAAAIEKGKPFSMAALSKASGAAAEALRAQGYPFALVSERAEVDRVQRWARVHLTATPGERFEIASMTIEGLERVREDLVRREIESAIGKVYSPKLMSQIESAVYGVQAFSSVSVRPGNKLAPGKLQLVVQVTEQRMQNVGFGILLDIDTVQWSQRAGVRYGHANLFGNLTKFDTTLLAGYAELPAPWNVQAHGPRVEFTIRLAKKGLLERKLLWVLEPKIEVEIREGYQLWGVKNRVGVSRFLGNMASLGLSYNNRFADFFNMDPDVRAELEELEQIIYDPYISSYLELQGELFKVDDVTMPTEGVRFLVTYQFANRYLGSDFDYHLVQPELRGYFEYDDRIQLGARARVGFIFPYSDSTTAPVDLRLYLGGVGDVRGWPLRHLSPRLEICDDNAEMENCRSIPIGGNTEVLGNLEARIRIVKELWLAVFGDVGDVRDGIATIRPSGWMYSIGTGLRYRTPIGPLRLDFGLRLNKDQERFPEPRMWAIHFSLGEAF